MQNYRTKTDINTNQTESRDMGSQSYGSTSFSCMALARDGEGQSQYAYMSDRVPLSLLREEGCLQM